jgi:Holliday junction resolvase RusA-like endonuclease
MTNPPITFFVPGRPIAKQSFRYGKGGSYQRQVVKDWQATVAQYAMIAMQGRDRFEGAIKINLEFQLPEDLAPQADPDLDNLSKCILDGLQGVAFDNDKMVYSLHLHKRYTGTFPPGVRIMIEHLPDHILWHKHVQPITTQKGY